MERKGGNRGPVAYAPSPVTGRAAFRNCQPVARLAKAEPGVSRGVRGGFRAFFLTGNDQHCSTSTCRAKISDGDQIAECREGPRATARDLRGSRASYGRYAPPAQSARVGGSLLAGSNGRKLAQPDKSRPGCARWYHRHQFRRRRCVDGCLWGRLRLHTGGPACLAPRAAPMKARFTRKPGRTVRRRCRCYKSRGRVFSYRHETCRRLKPP